MATRLTIRLDFDSGRRLGAGKVSLLEAINQRGETVIVYTPLRLLKGSDAVKPA